MSDFHWFSTYTSIMILKLALESTNQKTVPKTLNLESSSPDDAALRLEDILGLMFESERKSFRLEIQIAKGGQGKSVKTAVQKVLTE